MEETTIHKSPVSVRRSGRTGSFQWTTNNCSMLPAKCHAEEHSHGTSTPVHECGHKLEGEKLS